MKTTLSAAYFKNRFNRVSNCAITQDICTRLLGLFHAFVYQSYNNWKSFIFIILNNCQVEYLQCLKHGCGSSIGAVVCSDKWTCTEIFVESQTWLFPFPAVKIGSLKVVFKLLWCTFHGCRLFASSTLTQPSIMSLVLITSSSLIHWMHIINK